MISSSFAITKFSLTNNYKYEKILFKRRMLEQQKKAILVVENDSATRLRIVSVLEKNNFDVTHAENGIDAFQKLDEAIPNLIISDADMTGMPAAEFVRKLRENAMTTIIPLILLTDSQKNEELIEGLGVDDYVSKNVSPAELLTRVRFKIERPSIPAEFLVRDQQTGLFNERRFRKECEREIFRVERGGKTGCLAYLYLYELPRVRESLGARAEAEVAKQVAAMLSSEVSPVALIGREAMGHFSLLLPETEPEAAKSQLDNLSQKIVNHCFKAGREKVRFTPYIGFSAFDAGIEFKTLRNQALAALAHAESHLDLQSAQFTPEMQIREGESGAKTFGKESLKNLLGTLRLPYQIAGTLIIGLALPYLIYILCAVFFVDITNAMYLVCVVMLFVTAFFIWTEGFLALRRTEQPLAPGEDAALSSDDPPSALKKVFPPATAIIAAYLPNEAATIEETIEAFLRLDYPSDLQIILAYNTPKPMRIEETLRKIAERDSRFLPFRVDGSTSKAQNVNAALTVVNGEFVGVFDADHHPDSDSFVRAWRWLSNGFDVVQGHCLIRNGDASWVARMIAIEFENIYAVSHPGRARLHGFGIFGGSNGYWKTDLLRQTRMHGFMLTEDIDSSLRIIEAGYKIVSDPNLISRELAPVTIKALWNQRLRWAQGWFQVTLKHLGPGLKSPHLTLRNKLGIFHLLIWREIYHWVSLQMFPILAFWIFWREDELNWFVPLFVFTTIFTLSTGPGQILFTYPLADQQIKERRRWFVSYLFVSFFFYTEFKNLIARLAQLKELMGERAWKVTPRATNKVTAERFPEKA